MTKARAQRLKIGDVVKWNDPDGGVCSKFIRIAQIKVRDDMVQITDTEDDYLEALPEELEFEPTVKLQMVVTVEYQPFGTPVSELKQMFRDIPEYAAGNGLMTGTTGAEVDVWKASSVKEL